MSNYPPPYAVPTVPAPAPIQFSPGTDLVYEIPVSPRNSPPQVSYGDRDRGEYYDPPHGRGLGPPNVGRSNSTKGYRSGSNMEVAQSRGRPRSQYYVHGGGDDYYRGRGGVSYGGGGGGSGVQYYPDSQYSTSSRGSHRHRSPSCHSHDGYEYDRNRPPYPHGNHWPQLPAPPPPQFQGPPVSAMSAMTLFNPNPPHLPDPAEDLAKKIELLKKELEESKKESDQIKSAKEAEEKKRQRAEELQRAVAEQLEKVKMAEEKAKRDREAEKEKVRQEAMKLMEEEKQKQLRAEQERKAKEEERKLLEQEAVRRYEEQKKLKEYEDRVKKENEDRIKKESEERIKKETEERMKMEVAKATYTKFSKTHLCKEALDEQGIKYSEQDGSYLVHRYVDREEQLRLWARTKEIRAYQLEYQRKFKEAADKAPIIQTQNGPIKIVKVGNNAPVTVPVVMVTKKASDQPEIKFGSIFRPKDKW